MSGHLLDIIVIYWKVTDNKTSKTDSSCWKKNLFAISVLMIIMLVSTLEVTAMSLSRAHTVIGGVKIFLSKISSK